MTTTTTTTTTEDLGLSKILSRACEKNHETPIWNTSFELITKQDCYLLQRRSAQVSINFYNLST
jgi:hypothetical protein